MPKTCACSKHATFKNDLEEYFCESHACLRQDAIDNRAAEALHLKTWDIEKIANEREHSGLEDQYPYLIDPEQGE